MNSSDGVGLNNYLVIVAASGYEYNIRYSIPCSYKSIIVIFVGENEAITRNVDGGRKKLFGAATIYIFTIHYYTLSDYSAHLDPLFRWRSQAMGDILRLLFVSFHHLRYTCLNYLLLLILFAISIPASVILRQFLIFKDCN